MRQDFFSTVSIYDPAFDFQKTADEDYDDFLKGDRANAWRKFALRPGMQPTIYWLREIPDHIMDGYVHVQPSIEGKFSAAFRAAVMKVERGIGRDGHALPLLWEPAAVLDGKVSVDGANVVELLTQAEALLFDRPTRQEIGGVALSLSDFCYRGSVVRWLLPPLSRRIWEAVQSRSLAAPGSSTGPDAASSSTPAAPPAATSAPPAPASAETSDAPGAATVTG